jgi:2-phosphoglycerate kinase
MTRAADAPTARPWHVLLVAGASGVGKSRLAHQLARHYDVGLVEIDDFQQLLERLTTPEQFPAIHYVRTHPDEWARMDAGERLATLLRYAGDMSRALEVVIGGRLEGGAPCVIEGDFILPTLALQAAFDGVPAAGRVGALVLLEDDAAQIERNYLAREGRPQPLRAQTSWLHSEWLRAEATRLGIPTVAARPWESVLGRALDLLARPPARD